LISIFSSVFLHFSCSFFVILYLFYFLFLKEIVGLYCQLSGLCTRMNDSFESYSF
jgi:hypothetical protein